MTFVLGLTGSIATGKSTVLQMFEEAGVPTYSADQAVHDLYEAEAVAQVAHHFPSARQNGKIDRKILAQLIVDAPNSLKILESVVHPLVHKKTTAFLTQHSQQNTPLIVLEIPLLFETKNTYPTNGIAVTWCSDDVQRARAMARPGMTAQKLATILARQIPQDEKKQSADYLINTGTALEDTRAQIMGIIDSCQT